MTKRISLLVIFAFIIMGFSFKENHPDDLIDNKAPVLNVVTSNGFIVDTSYFKGKVTLLNFMYISCKPCMVEIPTLNKIYTDINSTDFQMLSIAAHTKEQLNAFLSDSISIYSSVRKRYNIEAIKFNIAAEFGNQNEIVKSEEIELMCNTISDKFHVEGYPTNFLIDQNGYVRKVFEGFSLTGKDTVIEQNIKTEIVKLLEDQ